MGDRIMYDRRRMNLARLGEDSVRTFGEYVSLAFEGHEWTNVEQQRAASRFAHALQRLGLRPGDRAVVLLPNCPEVLQAYAGILKAGGVIVPVVFLLGPDEVRHILTDSGAKVVVTAPEFLGKIEGWTGTVVLIGGGGAGLAWDELIATEPDTFPTVDRDDDDLAVILYTAGTTGRPKGVALSHANLASNARATASLYELDRTKWSLMVLPLSHSYGLTVMNAGSILGTKGVLLRWFTPEGVLETIQRYRVEFDGRRADDARPPAALPRRRAVRHLVDALVGLGRRSAATRDRRAVRDEVRRPDPRGLRPHRGLAGRECASVLRRAQARLGRPAHSRRGGGDPRRRRPRAAGRRARRGVRAWRQCDARLLPAGR
jgi:acyl-CoA synthetase (AMP-forming)/AMP-acid ligase II